MSATDLLSVEALTVRYGSFTAVKDMTMRVEPGQIVGLIGPNGAGKSTVINAVSGAVQPTTGKVFFQGQPTKGQRMDQLAQKGMVRTFQNLEVFPTMTVLENVLIRVEASPTRKELTRTERIDKCLDVIDAFGLTRQTDAEVGDLAYPERKLLEFARAMVLDATLLLLDEPTAGLAVNDRQSVVALVVNQMRERNISGVVVEHDMKVVRAMCDDVYVMDAGERIAHGTFDEVTRDQRVREAYLGKGAA
jgi:ABC-type branched-subunit amino acid transport system ATPase component